MTRVSDIMTRDVASVTADSTLSDLAAFFVEEDVSGAPVLSGGEVVGVVSVTDLIEFDVEDRGLPAYEGVENTARPIDDRRGMAEDVDGPAAYYAQPWEEAGTAVKSRLGSGDPLWSSLDDHTVEEVMTRDLLTLTPDADVRDAARAMIDADVHRLLVIDDGRLAGLVTTTDVVRAVADHGLAG